MDICFRSPITLIDLVAIMTPRQSNYSGYYTEVTTTIPFVICAELLYAGSNDEIDIDINVSVPNDAGIGDKSSVITATGETL